MIRSFGGEGTEDVFNGKRSRSATSVCPPEIWRVARRKLFQLDSAEALQDLASPPGNRLQDYCGDRKGFHSIRINDQYRLCFRWTEGGPEEVTILDDH